MDKTPRQLSGKLPCQFDSANLKFFMPEDNPNLRIFTWNQNQRSCLVRTPHKLVTTPKTLFAGHLPSDETAIT